MNKRGGEYEPDKRTDEPTEYKLRSIRIRKNDISRICNIGLGPICHIPLHTLLLNTSVEI